MSERTITRYATVNGVPAIVAPDGTVLALWNEADEAWEWL